MHWWRSQCAQCGNMTYNCEQYIWSSQADELRLQTVNITHGNIQAGCVCFICSQIPQKNRLRVQLHPGYGPHYFFARSFQEIVRHICPVGLFLHLHMALWHERPQMACQLRTSHRCLSSAQWSCRGCKNELWRGQKTSATGKTPFTNLQYAEKELRLSVNSFLIFMDYFNCLLYSP